MDSRSQGGLHSDLSTAGGQADFTPASQETQVYPYAPHDSKKRRRRRDSKKTMPRLARPNSHSLLARAGSDNMKSANSGSRTFFDRHGVEIEAREAPPVETWRKLTRRLRGCSRPCPIAKTHGLRLTTSAGFPRSPGNLIEDSAKTMQNVSLSPSRPQTDLKNSCARGHGPRGAASPHSGHTCAAYLMRVHARFSREILRTVPSQSSYNKQYQMLIFAFSLSPSFHTARLLHSANDPHYRAAAGARLPDSAALLRPRHAMQWPL